MTWMLLPMVPMVILHVLFLGRTLGRLSPTSLFIYMQFIMAVGTLPVLEERHAADQTHGWIILLTFALFWSTAGVLSVAESKANDGLGRGKEAVKTYWAKPTGWMVALLVLSVLVCLAYYTAIGYNVLAVGLSNAMSGGSSDIASMRLESYAGSEYFYPGYVNQFKNGLLPALLCVIIPYLFNQRVTGRWIWSGALSIATLIFILGTGQRGAFVTFMITIVLFISIMERKNFPKRMLWVGVVTVPIFFITTLALGRSGSALQRSGDFFERIWIILGEIIFRILGSNQLASTTGFRYIYANPQVNGAEWWQSMVGLLPGVPGSTLSNEIFAQLYGSTRGTAPPSIWGATYHNFGLVGTLLFSLILAIAYHQIGKIIRLAPCVSSVQAIGMAGVTTVLGTWVAGSPDYLLNVGLVVYIFLWRWGSRLDSASPMLHQQTARTG